jgi:hypothetical protein
MAIVDGDEILSGRLPFQDQWLHNQESPVLVIPVADRGYYSPNNFAQYHRISQVN